MKMRFYCTDGLRKRARDNTPKATRKKQKRDARRARCPYCNSIDGHIAHICWKPKVSEETTR